jgi:hypothetical protein
MRLLGWTHSVQIVEGTEMRGGKGEMGHGSADMEEITLKRE